MQYISAIEASEKWGISLRQVQRLLAGKRIPCAKKYGGSWMLPANAGKPMDLRKERKQPQPALVAGLERILASTTIPMPANHPDAILLTAEGDGPRFIYEAELAYLRGDFARSLACYHRLGSDDAARLCAAPRAIAATISMGDYHTYTEIDSYLKQIIRTHRDSKVRVIAECAFATAAVSVIAPAMAPAWLIEGDLNEFPPVARLDVIYLRAKYFQCIGEPRAMLEVAKTALSLSSAEPEIKSYDIYLRLMCSVACHCLERRDEARRWLLSAMHIALPHGFITPFAENITALGGLMEQCLKQEFPGCYNAVMEQWKRTWKNWISFHNQFTKDNITLILSLREYHLASLVARRVPYSKIAEQYGISVGRLRNIMQGIREKLFISDRDELAKYIL